MEPFRSQAWPSFNLPAHSQKMRRLFRLTRSQRRRPARRRRWLRVKRVHSELRHLQMPAVSVVGRTGTLGRDHRGAQRRLRGALFAEGWTVGWFLQALEHLTANTRRRFLRLDVTNLEEPLCIVIAIFVTKLVAALGDRADATPLAVADLEDFVNQVLRGSIPLPTDSPAVLVLHLR